MHQVHASVGFLQGTAHSAHSAALQPATQPSHSIPSHSSLVLQSVGFGMGGGLLQRVNRDTLSLATKLCHIVYADGSGGRKRGVAAAGQMCPCSMLWQVMLCQSMRWCVDGSSECCWLTLLCRGGHVNPCPAACLDLRLLSTPRRSTLALQLWTQ